MNLIFNLKNSHSSTSSLPTGEIFLRQMVRSGPEGNKPSMQSFNCASALL